jgi:hypothetical protein
VSTLGIVAMVSTPSDLHEIYLQPHGSNTTVLQNSDNKPKSKDKSCASRILRKLYTYSIFPFHGLRVGSSSKIVLEFNLNT